MRSRFDEQLAQLERELIEMGALCEESIALAVKSLGDGSLARQVAPLDTEIDRKERDIESDRKSTRLNSSHTDSSRMPSSA